MMYVLPRDPVLYISYTSIIIHHHLMTVMVHGDQHRNNARTSPILATRSDSRRSIYIYHRTVDAIDAWCFVLGIVAIVVDGYYIMHATGRC